MGSVVWNVNSNDKSTIRPICMEPPWTEAIVERAKETIPKMATVIHTGGPLHGEMEQTKHGERHAWLENANKKGTEIQHTSSELSITYNKNL